MTQTSLKSYIIIGSFKAMIDDKKKLHYITSIEMVIKELRNDKKVSQSVVNLEFEEKYGFSINLGRMESNPNFRMIKLLYICDYFNISISDFFKKVVNTKTDDILDFLEEKAAKKQKRRKGK